jgi:mRNA interferase MazF
MDEIYIKDFDKWNAYQKTLDKQEFEGFCREREVWWCALGVNIGSEQDGKNNGFERPTLILKKISDELLLVAPFTSKLIKNRYSILSWPNQP